MDLSRGCGPGEGGVAGSDVMCIHEQLPGQLSSHAHTVLLYGSMFSFSNLHTLSKFYKGGQCKNVTHMNSAFFRVSVHC